jgi:hypothetical protein
MSIREGFLKLQAEMNQSIIGQEAVVEMDRKSLFAF